MSIIGIRAYTASDQEAVITLLRQTIQAINRKDYDPDQIKAWSAIDEVAWPASLKARQAVVMLRQGELVGFADMDRTGYLDRLFVHKDHQNEGIATALLAYLEQAVPTARYSTYASLTARPFFEARGYCIVRENIAFARGQHFKNYFMVKELLT